MYHLCVLLEASMVNSIRVYLRSVRVAYTFCTQHLRFLSFQRPNIYLFHFKFKNFWRFQAMRTDLWSMLGNSSSIPSRSKKFLRARNSSSTVLQIIKTMSRFLSEVTQVSTFIYQMLNKADMILEKYPSENSNTPQELSIAKKTFQTAVGNQR